MTRNAAELAVSQPLCQRLCAGTPQPLYDSLRLIQQVAVVVQSLHRSGRIHRAIDADTVTVDDQQRAQLAPAPALRRLGGDCSDPEYCPPDLAEGDALELPEALDAAAALLQARGHTLDPRRIDIYQLGTLLCRLLTGHSVLNYMYTAHGKTDVPAVAHPLLERALGYDASARFNDADSLLSGLDEVFAAVGSTAEPPARQDTPPHGSAVGLIGDTPRHGHPAASENSSTVGELPLTRLGHHRILARIGRGGMGDVYQGYDESLQREVAIKVLPTELAREEDFVRRFHAEATAAAQIAHPNVVPIYSIGEDGGNHFFAMQYIRGESLSARLALQRRLPVDESLNIVEGCLEGLGAAHARGLIHRDIKPGNILLESETNRALLVDFGLVRRIDDTSQNTATGVVMGTVDYIAPEQARGQQVDARTDLYSLGVLLYQLLSGRLPFIADTPTAMVFQHAYEQPLPLTEAAPDVPEPLHRIVTRLMAKSPAERYQNAHEVLADLQAFRAGRPLASGTPQGAEPAETAAPSTPSELDEDGAWLAELPEVPRDGRWQRAREWVATTFRRHAPDVLQQLQSTSQQVDGAVAVYERRRNRLARLVQEGQSILQDLPDGAGRDQHAQQLESLRLQLAKSEATLARLRSQRDLLQARLRAAEAWQVASSGSRRATRRRWAIAAGILAAGTSCLWIVLAFGDRRNSSVSTRGFPSVPRVQNEPSAPTIGVSSVERLREMRQLVESIEANRVTPTVPVPIELVPEPALRSRSVPDGGDLAMWIWGSSGRPLAFLKLFREVPTRRWIMSMGLLGTERVTLRSPKRWTWGPSDSGLDFRPLSPASPPASIPGVRTQQLTEVAKRFQAFELSLSDRQRLDLALAAEPSYRYADASAGIIDGGMFCFSCDGWDPRLVLLVEAVERDDSSTSWQYAFNRCTIAELHVSLDGREVWQCPMLEHNSRTREFYWSNAPVASPSLQTASPKPGTPATP
jgi:serine/threonine protein kinase